MVQTKKQKTIAIYAPYHITKGVPFQVFVCIQDETEIEFVSKRIKQSQTDARLREENPIPTSLSRDCELNISLSFQNNSIGAIQIENGEQQKSLFMTEKFSMTSFVVNVLPEYTEAGFLTNVKIVQRGSCLLNCCFNIIIGSHCQNEIPEVELAPWNDKYGSIVTIDKYKQIFDALLFGNRFTLQFKKYLTDKKYLNAKCACDKQLNDIRNFLYVNDLFIKPANNILKSIEKELSEIKENSSEHMDSHSKMVTALLWRLWGVQIELNRIQQKYSNFFVHTFHEFLRDFLVVEDYFLDCLLDVKILRDQTAMLKQYLIVWDMINKKTGEHTLHKENSAIKVRIKECAKLFYERVCSFDTDKTLFDIFTKCGGTKSIIHAKTGGGVTLAFLALFISLVQGQFVSVDDGKEAYRLNIAHYIDFSQYHGSLRTPKNRINKMVSLLDKPEIRNKIKQYQLTREGRISVAAFSLLNMKITIK